MTAFAELQIRLSSNVRLFSRDIHNLDGRTRNQRVKLTTRLNPLLPIHNNACFKIVCC